MDVLLIRSSEHQVLDKQKKKSPLIKTLSGEGVMELKKRGGGSVKGVSSPPTHESVKTWPVLFSLDCRNVSSERLVTALGWIHSGLQSDLSLSFVTLTSDVLLYTSEYNIQYNKSLGVYSSTLLQTASHCSCPHQIRKTLRSHGNSDF